MKTATPYLKTSHWDDAISSLEAAHEFTEQLAMKPHYWKWVVIAVHSAIQGFMALALEQGNSLPAMTEKGNEKWIQSQKTGEIFSTDRLDAFISLYRKVKSSEVCHYFGSRSFPATEVHDDCMRELNRIRNDFIHFFPKNWTIETRKLRDICINCLELVEFLGWDSYTIIWHDAELSNRGRTAVTKLQLTLRQSN